MSQARASAQFSFAGHQTFPFRQLWPYKAYHEACEAQFDGRRPFDEDTVMARLGVGANMVASMKFWARSIGIVNAGDYSPTEFGQDIFGSPKVGFSDGLDPYCESASTLWLFHWALAKNSRVLTVLWFVFNKFNRPVFSKNDLTEDLLVFLHEQEAAGRLKMPSAKTLERDIEVVLRAYSPKTRDVGVLRKVVAQLDNAEDVADDPLRELGLIKIHSINNGSFNYSFVRAAHPSLNNALFACCLLDYRASMQDGFVTLDFNRLAYDEGCVGRVFKLDENSLGEHLQQLSDTTGGVLQWSEQNGLRQVVCKENDAKKLAKLQKQMLEKAFENE